MYDEQGKRLTISGTNSFGDELRQVTKGEYIIAPIERYSGIKDFNEKRKCCSHRYLDSVYFHTLFFIIF